MYQWENFPILDCLVEDLSLLKTINGTILIQIIPLYFFIFENQYILVQFSLSNHILTWADIELFFALITFNNNPSKSLKSETVHN